MKIIILSRDIFNNYLKQKGVTPENVEKQDKMFFISILNPDDIETPYFMSDKENVKVMTFPDLDKDGMVTLVGTQHQVLQKAFTQRQAAELFQFIKKHKDKEAVLIHCTLGVARSGAVGTFINDYISGDWESFKRTNPQIQPNAHVYRLLHDEWYKDHSHNDSITGEKIKNSDSITTTYLMNKEEIKEKFGEDAFNGVSSKPMLLDEAGQLPVAKYEKRGVEKGEDRFVGMRFSHPDGSSTYVQGIDPYRNEEPEFEQFWLETDQYYGMVEQSELEILSHCHPNMKDIMLARKQPILQDEYEAFAQFGFGDEYTGMLLRDWLRLKNMVSFFEPYEPAIVMTNKYTNDPQGKYGIDGANFLIALNKKFQYRDVLYNGFKDLKPLFVTDEPVIHMIDGGLNDKCEYWLHTVRIMSNHTHFYPGNYLLPGTEYYKIIA